MLNVLSNQNGTVLTNNASLRYTDAETGVTTINDPTPPTITVVEPILTLNKQIVLVSPPTADMVQITYRLTVAHAANSKATAYDVRITDALPTDMHLCLRVGRRHAARHGVRRYEQLDREHRGCDRGHPPERRELCRGRIPGYGSYARLARHQHGRYAVEHPARP